MKHFAHRAFQSKHISSDTIAKKEFLDLLKNKINTIDVDLAKEDVINFIKNKKTLDNWSEDYFSQLTDLIKFKE